MHNGLSFENQDNDLAIVKNGEVILSSELLYSLVFDLLTVDCFLPEEWTHIRQRFDPNKKTFELSIGAESAQQVSREIIDDEKYINELREGEYFLESVIDPQKFVKILRNKLSYLGLSESADFRIEYNRRLGRISVVFTSHS